MKHQCIAALLVSIFAVSACDNPLTTSNAEPSAHAIHSQSSVDPGINIEDVPAFIDAHYRELANRIPGYGGHFFAEDGTLIVYLSNPAMATVARSVLAPLVADYEQREGISNARIEIRDGDYHFAETHAATLGFTQGTGLYSWRMGTRH